MAALTPDQLTQNELNAVGGMSLIGGGFQSAYNPPLPQAPTPRQAAPAPQAPTPAPTAAPQPTVQSELDRIKQEALGIQDILNQRAAGEATIGESLGLVTPTFETGPTFEDLYPDIDENAVRRNQMRLFQQEINATNQLYDEMLAQERLRGQGRLGTQRAISARSGLLGSDFGEANRANVESLNVGQERAIQAERQARIGAIMGTMRKAVADELTEKRQARQQGADNYIKWLASSQERKANNANIAAASFLQAGIDPTTADPAELTAIAQEAGLSTDDIIFQYRQLKANQDAAAAKSELETRKTEAEIAKIEADIAEGKIKTLGEGTMLYNTETGETFKNPKTYAPTAASGLKIGAGTLNQEAVADVHAVLQESRGPDGYANTGLYMQELEGFVALGGDPKDFIKEYDPDIYINPNDPTRSFLQSQMKKPASDNLFLGSLGGIDIGSAIAEASSGN